jgi:hypothetical protein
MINPLIMYGSSILKDVPAKITVDNTNPANTDIPPRFGMIFLCDVRPLIVAQRFFNLEVCTIDGIVYQVMPNAIRTPRMITIQKGTVKEKMLKGKVKIQVFRWLTI